MNIGLGNLAELKTHLLAKALQVSSYDKHDDQITAIGKGVAKAFDSFCNRKLAYSASDYFYTDADRQRFYLERFPVNAVSAFHYKNDEAAGWVADTAQPYLLNTTTGLFDLGSRYGDHNTLIRVTYSGGYWFDTSEDETETLTLGATALPDDLKLAWYLQCQETWNQKDRLGLGIVVTGEKKESARQLELLPYVRDMLVGYVLYT